MRTMFQSFMHALRAHEHLVSWAAFFGGVLWDTLTLQRIDRTPEIIMLVLLALLAAGGTVLWYFLEEREALRAPRLRAWVPLVVQFSLGGLLSALWVLYARSGTLLSAWPFLVPLGALLVANEFLRHSYRGMPLLLSVYFFALFSLFALLAPVVAGTMGSAVFLAGSAAAALAMAGVVRAVAYVSPMRFSRARRGTIAALGAVFVALNGMYFFNLIPPIPLSLKEVGIYHEVVRQGTQYLVRYERPAWWEPWRRADRVFHRTGEEPLYCFASVFAPTRLTTAVVHRWQYQDAQGEWRDADRIAYPLTGGRGAGYRGYTVKQNVWEGKWRCRVETSRGAVLGEATVTVRRARTAPPLVADYR